MISVIDATERELRELELGSRASRRLLFVGEIRVGAERFARRRDRRVLSSSGDELGTGKGWSTSC